MNINDHVFEKTKIAGQSRCVAETLILDELRGRLQCQRIRSSLFHGGIFAKHLELAYEEMYRRNLERLKPDDIDVAALLSERSR